MTDRDAIRWAFGAPMLNVVLDDAAEMNRALAAYVLELEASQPSVRQSNRGGWQSEKTLHTVDVPVIRHLFRRIDDELSAFTCALSDDTPPDDRESTRRITAWANVNRAGDFNALHHHQHGFWSGVYYVAVAGGGNGASGDGGILFRSPSVTHLIASGKTCPLPLRRTFAGELTIKPDPGLLLIFPSWLEHAVHAHHGTNPRISVAFDISYQ